MEEDEDEEPEENKEDESAGEQPAVHDGEPAGEPAGEPTELGDVMLQPKKPKSARVRLAACVACPPPCRAVLCCAAAVPDPRVPGVGAREAGEQAAEKAVQEQSLGAAVRFFVRAARHSLTPRAEQGSASVSPPWRRRRRRRSWLLRRNSWRRAARDCDRRTSSCAARCARLCGRGRLSQRRTKQRAADALLVTRCLDVMNIESSNHLFFLPFFALEPAPDGTVSAVRCVTSSETTHQLQALAAPPARRPRLLPAAAPPAAQTDTPRAPSRGARASSDTAPGACAARSPPPP